MSIYLRILKGPGTGQVLPVPAGQPVTLGRSAQASYAFDDPLLSRKHCAIESRGDLCRIVDLQSRNGTYVNGQRVGAVREVDEDGRGDGGHGICCVGRCCAAALACATTGGRRREISEMTSAS